MLLYPPLNRHTGELIWDMLLLKVAMRPLSGPAGNFAYERVKGESEPLQVRQVQEQLYLAVDRIMGEGGLYAPELAALAFKQAAGDTLESSFMLRAYRATQPRLGYSLSATTGRCG